MNKQNLAIISIGFVFGVFLESFVNFGFALSGLFVLLALVVFVFAKNNENFDKESKSKVIFLPLIFFSISLGVFRMAFFVPNEFPLDDKLNQKVSLNGVIYDEPDARETQTFLKVSVNKTISNKKDVSVKILVKTGSFPEFSYGDYVSASGTLKKPEKFETDGGGVFDYPSYLSKDGIYYILEKASVEKIAEGKGNWLKSGLFSIKQKFIETVGKTISEPESSLLAGLVIGGKRSLGSEWLDRFQKAGVMHVVVLSGYNITIVAESVMKFFGWFLPTTFSMVFGVLSIIFFAVMTGGSATVVRATIMAVIVILARATNRKYLVTRALIIAGVLMVLQNPAIVAFDPSFQLSFMATIALIYISPIIEPRLKFIPEKFKIREIFVSTLATQIFVLPLLLHMTGQFSIVGLFVNLLILAIIPTTMFFGFWTGIIGFFSTTLALPFASIAYALLFYELKVVEIFSSLPFASISLPTISGLATFIIYIFLVLGLWKWWKKINQKFENKSVI